MALDTYRFKRLRPIDIKIETGQVHIIGIKFLLELAYGDAAVSEMRW